MSKEAYKGKMETPGYLVLSSIPELQYVKVDIRTTPPEEIVNEFKCFYGNHIEIYILKTPYPKHTLECFQKHFQSRIVHATLMVKGDFSKEYLDVATLLCHGDFVDGYSA